MMEFQSNAHQIILKPNYDLKESSDSNKSDQIRSEEISAISDDDKIESNVGSVANDDRKQCSDGSYVRIDNKDISPICNDGE